MNAISIRTILLGFMRFITFIAAWTLVPVALLISLLPPFPLWIRLALVVLPVVIFASWLIKLSMCGQLDRKSSPLSFYVAMAVNVLFVIVVAAYIHGGGMVPLEKGIKHIFHMKRSPAIGLMADQSQRYRLFREGIKLDILGSFANSGTVAILDYKVNGYLLSTTRYLFNDIFINQQYFFAPDSPRPFILDCGSHIGMSILYAKTLYPDARVIGFEPAPDTFRLLSQNIRQNGLRDVTLVNKAVGNKVGTMKFYGDDSLTASLDENRNSGKVTEVEVVKLSRYIDRPVSFLKLDVEGAEGQVLEDLASEGKLQMIRNITIEYHHHIERDSDTLSKFLKILEDNNFGYLMDATADPRQNGSYQDIMIYAYRK
jgi:FkbM family methyltransferase